MPKSWPRTPRCCQDLAASPNITLNVSGEVSGGVSTCKSICICVCMCVHICRNTRVYVYAYVYMYIYIYIFKATFVTWHMGTACPHVSYVMYMFVHKYYSASWIQASVRVTLLLDPLRPRLSGKASAAGKDHTWSEGCPVAPKHDFTFDGINPA